MDNAERVFEEAKKLPPQMLPMVLDFLVFLRERATGREAEDLMLAQETSMVDLWANESDEVWNDVPTR